MSVGVLGVDVLMPSPLSSVEKSALRSRLDAKRVTARTAAQGAPGSRMRSAAIGEHRTGEDVGEAFTLAAGLEGARRRPRDGRRADPPTTNDGGHRLFVKRDERHAVASLPPDQRAGRSVVEAPAKPVRALRG